MQIKVNLDADDWMEFHKHHLLNNKQFQKTKLLITYAVPLVFGVFIYYKFQEGTLMMENGIMVVLMSALWVTFYPKRLVSKALTRARQSVENGEHGVFIGENEIQISEDEVRHKHGGTDSSYDWPAIQKVEEIAASLLIYTSSSLPIVIPKAKVESMQLKELKDFVANKGLL